MRQSVFTIIFLLGVKGYFAQAPNRFNKKGERTGKWLTHSDSAKTKKLFEGRYRKGNVVGHSYYYTMNGVLERREITRFKKLKTTFFYPNRVKRCSGKARIENLPNKIHYYFYGKWKYYDTTGSIQKFVFFEKGNEIKSIYKNQKDKTSDSLVDQLNKIQEDFLVKNNSLIDSINATYSRLATNEIYKTQLAFRDSVAFLKIENILAKYGYPSKQLSKEAYNIPFFILSYGPVNLRDKYSELLIKAANKGDLSWESLSFYIDRLEISKTGKQIYGTQHYFNKQKQWVQYPVTDPENLSRRRKEIGLKN